MREPFLKRVAARYADRNDLGELCFVFPNKRSCKFFANYLEQMKSDSGAPYMEPDMIDISEFVGRFSDKIEATRYEALFTLFNCYKGLNAENSGLEFERFLYWGEMLLGDFNDVDRYMVDPKILFQNLERLREIGTDYLTDEQLDVIRRYWGVEVADDDSKRFWTHIARNDVKSSKRFKQLWEVLGPLYAAFIDALAEKGLTTRGKLYRNAADSIGSRGGRPNEFSRVVFVGFNVLTTSEIKIFRRLKNIDCADFFWDFNSPALKVQKNRAGRFIVENMREFPMPKDFEEEPLESFPEIQVIGVPSSVGQTRMAAKTVDEWWEQGLVKTEQGDINTAVVLPDESLFLSMMNSLPEKVGKVNVTMGFPMRLTPLASLMSSIYKLQRNARFGKGAEHCRVEGYYHDDVVTLLSMPLVQAMNAEEALVLNKAIRDEFLFTVPVEMIKRLAPELAFLFAPLGRESKHGEVVEYMQCILENIEALDCDDMTKKFAAAYRDALLSLQMACDDFDVEMEPVTFMKLVNRAVRGDSINFKGDPVEGLQVMGVLETRALDFENVVMLSMNEGVFPRKNYTRSFIPDILRRQFGMATTDFQESIFAYYFYRLISRPKRVTLIYDSRAVGGVRNNEMSRYITQLLYLYPDAKVKMLSSGFKQPVFKPERPLIEKNEQVMSKLLRFTDAKSDYSLSASSINTYINCPLEFYLRYVEGFNPEDEITDYMTASVFGTIVHEVLEHLYGAFSHDGGEATVTAEVMGNILREDYPLLDHLISESINKHYHRITNPGRRQPLTGETRIFTNLIKSMVKNVVRADMEFMPLTYLGGEDKFFSRLEVTPDLTVNIKQVIDRIDVVDDVANPGQKLMRIVDYKTGNDATVAKSMENLFTADSMGMRCKAILQLLFYCKIYAESKEYAGPIQPLIYKIRELSRTAKVTPLKMEGEKGEPLLDYRTVIDEFMERLKTVLTEMFDKDVPFRASENGHSCTFCKFKSICGVRDNE